MGNTVYSFTCLSTLGGDCLLNTQKDVVLDRSEGSRVIGTYEITLEGPYIMLTCSRLAKLNVKPVI